MRQGTSLVFHLCSSDFFSVFAFYSVCVSFGLEKFYSSSGTGQNVKNFTDMCIYKNSKRSESGQEEGRVCFSLSVLEGALSNRGGRAIFSC